MQHSAQPDPTELLARVRAGASDAEGQLLELYRGYLTLLARVQIGRKLQAKTDASDLVQETFCEAHRHLGQFRGTSERELIHWLRTILARRVCRVVREFYGTQARDLRLERQMQQDLDQSSLALGQDFVASLTTPSRVAQHREHAVLLADALECLPAAYRDVLVWRHVEGLNFAEVAHRMDRSVDSVKHLWSRALEQLRCRLVKTT